MASAAEDIEELRERLEQVKTSVGRDTTAQVMREKQRCKADFEEECHQSKLRFEREKGIVVQEMETVKAELATNIKQLEEAKLREVI